MWKHCAWLVVDSFIFAGKVVNCVISLQLLTDRIQVFRCARVTRILCTSIKTRRVVICRLQVAGHNLKYARTFNAKLILRKKLSLQCHAKPEISLVPGNCLFGVRFCSPEPYRSKFRSFTLLKITANGKKPDVKLWWLMI